MTNKIVIGPQPGPQTAFLSTKADIAFYGGGAGGGKTYALLLDPLRHYHNGQFGAVIFRKNSVQVRNQGGLWDESSALYTQLNAHARQAFLEWQFPSGAKVKFAHLENENSVYDWQGSQIAMIGFDELTHFSETQFIYMLSRNRSTCGVKPYVRATCNPDVSSWVRSWVDWYLDSSGYAIPERSGVLRWFVRREDKIHWADSAEELRKQFGQDAQPKSFTFISSRITDNKILTDLDPSYISNLQALSRVERERLLDGNWNVKASAGNYFRKEWFEVVSVVPNGWTHAVRFWDRAATKPHEGNKDPDWTRGVRMLKYPSGFWLVTDLRSLRDTPLKVEQLIKNTASQDGRGTMIIGEQEGGSAGVADAGNFVRMLAGYVVKTRKPTEDKETRAKPVSAQCEAGNVKILKGDWNDEFFSELENFPTKGIHDDIVDALSGAFNELSGKYSILNVL